MQSTRPGEPSPFDDGELYDISCQGLDIGIDFYVGLAREAKGPVLDIACGTGNQLIADRSLAPLARLVGIDGSLGMLRQARQKAADIQWVHGDSAALPFATASFDFVSCQYALHHFRDKAGSATSPIFGRPGGLRRQCGPPVLRW